MLFSVIRVSAQVAINTDGSQPDNSSMLDIKSTSKGMLVPRMTVEERDAISNPATGLLIFCTTNNQFYTNKGNPSLPNWVMVSSQWVNSGSDLYFSGGKVGIGILNPGYHLDVNGDINFNGVLRQNGFPINTGVSAVSASSPLISSGGATPNISVPQANATTHGFLSSSDWLTFFNKQNALSFGNIQSGDINITGGGLVVGGGLNLSINKGNLTSSDLIILGGSGSVFGNGTNLSIIKGNMNSPDISIIGGTGSVLGSGTLLTINKGTLIETSSSVLSITGGSGAVLGSGTTIQVRQSTSSQDGYLSSTDWNIFNTKVSSQWTTTGTNIFYNSGRVGIGTSNPTPSAALDVTSTNSGVLLPRITKDQRDAINSPADGLMVYCTNCGYSNTSSLSVFSSGHWRLLSTYCLTPENPMSATHLPDVSQITWKWNPIQYAVGYKWNTLNDYNSAMDIGTNTSTTETGLSCNSNYQRYLWAYNECGEHSGVTLLTQSTLSIPVEAPNSGINIPSLNQITWNWNPVLNATGYKWNNVNNYYTATDVGTATSTTEPGLNCSSNYIRYIWAYSVCGFSSATPLTQTTTTCWSCGQPFIDTRNSKTYNTVLINTQCWMKENINIGTKINASFDQTNNGVLEKYCYNDLESNCDIYGGSYQWGEAVQYYNGATNSTTWYPYPTGNIQGICPLGWHLPMDGEWANLEIYLGGSSIAGGKMKETGTTHWASPNTGATNSSGFNGLPGGFRSIYATWEALSTGGYFWTATESSTTDSWSHFLQHNNANSQRVSYGKIYGWYVRCIKDN